MDRSEEVDGQRTIVLADDDAHIRDLLVRILQHRGYRVLGMSDGSSALACLADLRKDIHLLITDLSMPGLSGHHLIRRVRELRPGLPVICLSAQVNDLAVTDGVNYIPKPFALTGLVQKVCELLANTK